MKKIFRHILLNIFFPLAIGLCVYLLFYKSTYINSIFGISVNFSVGGFFGIFLKSWLCDILWAYALMHSVYLSLFAFSRRRISSAIISGVLVISFELLQYFGTINGTFDILDIIFELAAVIFAAEIIKRRDSKWKNFYLY